MFVSKKSDWIELAIPPSCIDAAKAMRKERDLRYDNRWVGKKTDARWVGDMGEMIMNDWLADQGIRNKEWITEDAAGKPDFIVEDGVRLGIKTVKRKFMPQLNYTAQVTAAHAKESVDWFVFLTCNLEKGKMWLLGAIEPSRFLLEAKYYKAGDKVHENYTIAPGHEIYNIEIARLNTMDYLLESIQKPVMQSPSP